jgi:REP element-mobilizing transposase RayT
MALLAYFLTWTTYGTRLHGDERGSVDRAHNRRGTAFLPAQPSRERWLAERLAGEPFVLTTEARAIVDLAIRDHVVHRGWDLLALNVRTNHVHVVVNCRGTHSAEAAMQQFKSWGTRRLIAAGLATSETHVWTDHGSTPHIYEVEDLMSAIHYVLNSQ